MELLNQPFTGQLGNRLIDLLASHKYHTLRIFVAFAKTSGVLRIKDAFENFRERGGEIEIFVGVDLGGTSYEALNALLRATDRLVVVHSEACQTYHPKIYQFMGDGGGLLFVGSHNLTGGGLWTNFESAVVLPLPVETFSGPGLSADLERYLEALSSLENVLMPITAQRDIDDLLHHGYVAKEVDEQVRRARTAERSGSLERLFGSGPSAKLPRLVLPKGDTEGAEPSPTPEAVAMPNLPTEEWQTIWFETKSMTGGSRNILDLSSKSLISRGNVAGTPFDIGDPRFMRGSVEFFGVDPNDTSRIKDIRLHFDGVDYVENKILFPTGERANGTWRIQIKGKDAAGRKITDAFRAKTTGHYLVRKIVSFTRVTPDYYLMSVVPDSELNDFEAASRILGRNGSSDRAKRVGIL